MMGFQINELFNSATSQGSRSNVLKPIISIFGIFLLTSLVLFYLKVDLAGYISLGFALLIACAAVFGFFYCLFKNPDLLRSEKHILERFAIEKASIKGDSIEGKVLPPKMEYTSYEEINIPVESKKETN